MKYIYLLLFLGAAYWLASCSTGKQAVKSVKLGGKIAEKIAALKKDNAFKDSFTVGFATIAASGKKQQHDALDITDTKASILEKLPDNMKLSLPINGRQVDLLLTKAKGSTKVITDKKDTVNQIFNNYYGIIDSPDNSLVSIAVSGADITGSVMTEEGVYAIGNSTVIKDTSAKNVFTDSVLEVPGNFRKQPISYSQSMTEETAGKCVSLYFETDYDIFVSKGNSVANVVDYINALFLQVQTLYANDGIAIYLKTLFVNTSPDSYTASTTNELLNQFQTGRPTFDADAGMLIGYNGNGGIAYVNALCTDPLYERGYAGISSSFNTVPSYSWSVLVLTHEIGHILGSRHTHDCVWNGNNTRIDDCGTHSGYGSVGGCGGDIPDPVGGGTIMGYCHLRSVGINFLLGFGAQPAAVIRGTINNAFCLFSCDNPPPPPPFNPPPIANAGGNQILTMPAGQTTMVVTISASGSTDTPPGFITQVIWASATPGVVIQSPFSISTTVIVKVGVTTISLSVSDDGGASGSDQMTITVNPAAPPPADNCPIGAHKDYITAKIDTFFNKAKAMGGPGTWNFQYTWYVNHTLLSIKTQILMKAGNYKKGDSLTVVINSANKPTMQHCYVTSPPKTIYIK